jgi:HEAT repeat protein
MIDRKLAAKSSEITREMGMQSWGVAPLFNFGTQADIDSGKGSGPQVVEHPLRVNNPEWIPVDRAGIRRMPGPISFAYPEARKALVKHFVRLARLCKLDGLIFHTYNENFGLINNDEFGFNEPIVKEYKKRYGVDIRKQKYDKQKLADLRGEYVTEFLRELHAALKKENIKLGVFIDSKHPELPQCWLASPKAVISGRITMNWRKWVDDGIVDQLFSYVNSGTIKTAELMRDYIGKRPVEVGLFCSGKLPPSALPLACGAGFRLGSGSYEDMECGAPRPLSAAKILSGSSTEKRGAIYQMGIGKIPPDMDKLAAAARDKEMLVRRRALRSIYQLGKNKPELINDTTRSAVKKSLDDPENANRAVAAHTLGRIASTEADFDALFAAVAKYADNPMWYSLPPGSLSVLPLEKTKFLSRGLRHPSPKVKTYVLIALRGSGPRPELLKDLLSLEKDPSREVRFALVNAMLYYRQPEIQEMLLRMLDDPEPTVRSCAAIKLSETASANSAGLSSFQVKVFKKLKKLFLTYADKNLSDADWGWRPVGMALQAMGPRGENFLKCCLRGDHGLRLAQLAWRVLYVHIDGWKHHLISDRKLAAAYAMYPREGKYPKVNVSGTNESEYQPYIVQDFGSDFKPGKNGEWVDWKHPEGGLWRNIAPAGNPESFPSRIVQEQGKRALLLLRKKSAGINGIPYVLRSKFRVSSGKAQIGFSLLLKDKGSQCSIRVCTSNTYDGNLMLMVSSDKIAYGNEKKGYSPSNIRIEPGQWYRFEINADFDKNLYSARVKGKDGQWLEIVKDQALSTDVKYKEYNCIFMFPGGQEGSACCLADINYKVSNPFFNKEN